MNALKRFLAKLKPAKKRPWPQPKAKDKGCIDTGQMSNVSNFRQAGGKK